MTAVKSACVWEKTGAAVVVREGRAEQIPDVLRILAAGGGQLSGAGLQEGAGLQVQRQSTSSSRRRG